MVLADMSLRMARQKSAIEGAVEGAMWEPMVAMVVGGGGAVERRHRREAAAVVEVRMAIMMVQVEGAIHGDAGVGWRWRLQRHRAHQQLRMGSDGSRHWFAGTGPIHCLPHTAQHLAVTKLCLLHARGGWNSL